MSEISGEYLSESLIQYTTSLGVLGLVPMHLNDLENISRWFLYMYIREQAYRCVRVSTKGCLELVLEIGDVLVVVGVVLLVKEKKKFDKA